MTDIRAAVEDLGSGDTGRRSAAMLELYRAGRDMAEGIFAEWRKDPEFEVLVTGEPIVGVAVPADVFQRLRQDMGMPPLADVPEEQNTAEFEMHRGGLWLDFLTPVDSSGPIQNFLDRFGPGIQQVELPVNSVDQATGVLSERFQLSPVYPQARAGAGGTRMNFFLVGKSGGGKLLIELFEAKR